MSKLLLVEDDNNLREIYEARLQAEGYTTSTAKDGEEALAVAKAEKPDLIISDVMMPKISGFEMLDILKNTDGLKNVKVIMLTALGQSDDQQRADKLGADRYLVKSQVTLEDIVRVAHELLEDAAPVEAAPAPVTANTPVAAPASAIAPEAVAVQPAPVVPTEPPVISMPAPAPQPAVVASPPPTPVTNTAMSEPPMPAPVATPATTPAEPVVPPVATATSVEPPTPAEPTASALATETTEEKTAEGSATAATSIPVFSHEEPSAEATSVSEEQASVDSQIEDFVEGASSDAPAPEVPAASSPTPESIPNTPPQISAPSSSTEPAPVPDEGQANVESSGTETVEPPVPASNQTMSHNKVIAPLPNSEMGEKKPDIQELLAKEEANEASKIPGASIAPLQTNEEDKPVDPNSIAL